MHTNSEMAPHAPSYTNYCLKSEVSIMLRCQLCSTRYTALQIKNCSKTQSTHTKRNCAAHPCYTITLHFRLCSTHCIVYSVVQHVPFFVLGVVGKGSPSSLGIKTIKLNFFKNRYTAVGIKNCSKAPLQSE